MKTIKPLPEGVRHSMRSGIIMFDMTRVVEELVYNSLDAGANKVYIFVGVVTCSVKVVDDGSGVSRDDLVLLGERYATSKFHDLTNVEMATESFGFRGEALASIADISLLEIKTKAIGRPNGYRKVMKGSKCLHLGIDDDRKDCGTTVNVQDLFYNQPVRRKYMQSSPRKVLESIKKCVFRIALVHSNVSFSVFDIESEDELFRSNPSSSAFSLLMRDAGVEASNSLCKVNVTDSMLNVSGYISGPGDSFKALQYIYINSRFISKGRIHKLLSDLAASFECADVWKPADGLQTVRRSRLQSNPGYILCITCPRHLYEFSFEPSKTNVEFKNWEPVLAFIERIILANWKKDKSPELFDEGADLPVEGDKQDLIDEMFRLENDWPEAMEPAKKKLKRSNDQSPCSFLLSPSADFKEDGYYLSQGKDDWSPQYEFELKIQNLKEQDTVAEYSRPTHSLQSCDIEMQPNEDFLRTSLVAGANCSKQFLTRCQSSRPRNIKHDILKESDVLSFQSNEFKDEEDVSNCIGKHLLRGCSSRRSPTLHEPKRSHGEGSESVMPMMLYEKRSDSLIHALETREGGSHSDVFGDTFEVHGITSTPNCSLGSPWQETDWFTPHRSSDRGSVGLGEDLDITPIGTADFCSYENKVFKKKYSSPASLGKSTAGSLCLSSEWSPVFSTPPATKWESDYQKGCQILEDSFRPERIPDPEYFPSTANNIKFEHEVPQMDWRDTSTDSFPDIKNSNQSDAKMHKSLWGHADNNDIEQYSIRKDEFGFGGVTHHKVGKQRSRRSCSAPPFHREKKRFISLSSKADTKPKNSDPSELDELECLTQPCSRSPMDLECSILDDVSNDHIQETKKGLSSASDLKASADSRIVHLETRDEDRDEDINSEENVDPIEHTTKWRQNYSVSQAANESHELHDQDNVLDISSGLLHLRSDVSLVPESINRHSLEDAKVLQQVDKKYIPIVAGGTVAIVDQHAADERIRLEELREKVLAGKGRTVTYLNADQELVLPEMGYQLLECYSEQIREWGWICNTNVEGSTSFKKNMSIMQRKPTPITLNAVPCILGVNLSDVDLLEFLQQLADTDGSSTVPPSVLRVLNSKACRGAIMFGDSLLPSECSLIIEGLRETSLCFQCAHGRPTTVPLVNLKALHKQIAKLDTGQLWHGFQRREITLDRAKARLDEAKG